MSANQAPFPAPVKPTREMYAYAVPPDIQALSGVKEVCLVLINGHEEKMATKRAGNQAADLLYRLVQESLREVDGRQVRTSDGSAEEAWNRMHPQLRQLVAGAYNELHSPPEAATQAFLMSKKVRVA